MKKNSNKKLVKLQKIEKKFTLVGTVAILSLWVISFFTEVSLSSLNVEVERLGKQVNKQEKTNQSLTMKINELASLENIQSVANYEGLAYNSSNILIVNKK